MEITVAVLISIISLGLAVVSFFVGRKDKAVSETSNSQREFGILQQKVEYISQQLDKILAKLDNYDNEIDNRVQKAIENHIAIYHTNHKGE